MSKHTPGPWVVVGSRTKYVEARLVGSLMQEVAACGPTLADEGYGQQQEANARLIAAAPTMYEYIASSASNGCAEARKIMEAINAGR